LSLGLETSRDPVFKVLVLRPKVLVSVSVLVPRVSVLGLVLKVLGLGLGLEHLSLGLGLGLACQGLGLELLSFESEHD